MATPPPKRTLGEQWIETGIEAREAPMFAHTTPQIAAGVRVHHLEAAQRHRLRRGRIARRRTER